MQTVDEKHLAGICELEKLVFGDVALAEHVVRLLFPVMRREWFVVAEDEEVWGYALGAINSREEEGWVLGFAVRPEHRGHGVGKLLLAHCLEELFVAGAGVVRLTVKPEDEDAVRLYHAAGFKKERDATDHLGPGHSRHVLVVSPDSLVTEASVRSGTIS